MWAKLRGWAHWPVAMWAPKVCPRSDMEQLVATWQPGRVLVHFFGEHSSMWVTESQLDTWGSPQDELRLHALLLWGRQKHRCVHNPAKALYIQQMKWLGGFLALQVKHRNLMPEAIAALVSEWLCKQAGLT